MRGAVSTPWHAFTDARQCHFVIEYKLLTMWTDSATSTCDSPWLLDHCKSSQLQQIYNWWCLCCRNLRLVFFVWPWNMSDIALLNSVIISPAKCVEKRCHIHSVCFPVCRQYISKKLRRSWVDKTVTKFYSDRVVNLKINMSHGNSWDTHVFCRLL